MDRDDGSGGAGGGRSGERAERLARQLRENLRRRKVQSRARRSADAETGGGDGTRGPRAPSSAPADDDES